MPYLINRTNGSKITTVQDGTIDTSSLDITLVGKNFTGYGEVFNENFVKMLENFSSNLRPVKPLSGQLWYDSGTRTLKLYTGIGTQPWKSLGLLETSTSKPVGNNAGDLWFNPTEGRLYAYSGVGSNWVMVGPLSSRSGESGALDYTVLKEGTGTSIVVKLAVDGRQPAIFSPETFNVDTTDPIYTSDAGAYHKIKKGITLGDIKDDATGVSYTPSTGGSILWGTAGSALGMVRNDDIYYPADSFLLTSALASLPNNINLTNDEGMLIGRQGIMKLHVVDNAGNISILNQGANRVAFKLNIGTVNSNVITVTTASVTQPHYSILPDSTSTIWVGTDSQRFSYGFFNTLTAQTLVSPSISGTTLTDSGNRVVTSVTHSAGNGIAISGQVTSGPTTSVTISNTGVLTVAGTTNQVNVSTSTGNVVFSLPQSIHSNASVTFARVTANTFTGVEIYDSNFRVITSNTIGLHAVSTLTGTTNQINVSAARGTVVLSTPQNIHTGASPTFSGITVSSISASGGSGTVTGAWSLTAGSTFQATFADLAERYAADAEYEPGTVLIIGGSAEVTTTTRHGDTARAGIVSTNPAYTLNAEAGDDSTHPYIALAGRVPCKVKGFVRKGDMLVTSTEPGYAEAAHANDNPNAVIARALEDFEGTTGVIEVMVV